MDGLESAIKGGRGWSVHLVAGTNNIRLVATSEEAAVKIEEKACEETEVVVVDNGHTLRLVCVGDLPDMAKALRELFAQAGPGEHLRKLPATAARPGTDTTKPGTYLRTRATKNGTLFIASASEKAYNNWLGKQENREARFKITSKNRFSDNVAATKEVGKKVEVVNQSVIDLTEETKQYHEIHTGISEDILKSFGNANRALAKLLTDKATPEKASR
eukprot:gene4318-5314_t